MEEERETGIKKYPKEVSFQTNSQVSDRLLVLCDETHLSEQFIQFFFSRLSRAVKFTSKLFGQALSKRIKVTILYATETGKSEMYAKKLGEIFGHAFHSQVC